MQESGVVLAQAARNAAAAREIADELMRYIEDLRRGLEALRLMNELDDLTGES